MKAQLLPGQVPLSEPCQISVTPCTFHGAIHDSQGTKHVSSKRLWVYMMGLGKEVDPVAR